MPFQAYFSHGKTEDEDKEPTPGKTYWVVVRTDSVEMAFKALLTTRIQRDHRVEKEDRTPSYQFDNGVILHGSGIRFFREMPEKPLKSLRICTIHRDKEGSDYAVYGVSELFGEDRRFSKLAELREFLQSHDVDPGIIPNDDFIGRQDFDLKV